MGPRAKRAVTTMAVSFAAVVAWASEGCRDATQMELDVTFGGSCSDLHAVGLIVGTDPYAAESRIDGDVYTTTTSSCTQLTPTSAKVGTLVVTPNGSTDRASIIVLAGIGKPVESCSAKDGYFGCIVARRAFTFVPHTGLTLEISLDPDCLNVPCSAVSTCSHKQCVDSNVECTGSGCGPVGVLGDGGSAFVDAPTTSDAFVQEEMDGFAPDGPITDASVDAHADASAGDAAACQMPKTALRCNVGAQQVSCGLLDHCCVGPTSGLEGGAPTYACRAAASCAPPTLGNTDINCTSARNCPSGTVCCLPSFGAQPTTCAADCASITLPVGAPPTKQLCVDDCECPGGGVCMGPITLGSPVPQTANFCMPKPASP